MKKIVLIHHINKLGGGSISLVDIYDMLKDDYDIKVILPKNQGQNLEKFINQKDIIYIDQIGTINFL